MHGEGGRRKEGGGRRGRGEQVGGRRGEGGGSSSQTVESADYLFSRSLSATSAIILEALDEQDCVLESPKRSQIDKMSVLEN